MKKKLLSKTSLLLFLGIVLAALQSCNSEEPVKNYDNISENSFIINEDEAYTKLISDINQLKNENGIESRKLGNFFKIMLVVASDAVGALVGSTGGIVGAASCASFASCSTAAALSTNISNGNSSFDPHGGIPHRFMAATPSVALDNLILNDFQITKSDSIGYFHNYIITYSNYNSLADSTLNRQNIKNTLSAVIINNFDNDVLSDFYAYDNINNYLLNNVITSINSYDSLDDYFYDLSTLYPNEQWIDVLSSFLQVVESYGENADKSTFINAYQIVNSSNISLSDREKLKKAITVAYASYVLWL